MYFGVPSGLNASMLIVHGAAPTAVSIVPATAVAVTETSHVAWPGMTALKLLRWGLRRSTVTLAPEAR